MIKEIQSLASDIQTNIENKTPSLKSYFSDLQNERGNLKITNFEELKDKVVIELSSYGNSSKVEVMKSIGIKIYFDGVLITQKEITEIINEKNYKRIVIRYANYMNLLKYFGYTKMYNKDNGKIGCGTNNFFYNFGNNIKISEYMKNNFINGTQKK